MDTKDIAKTAEIKQKAIDYYINAKQSGEYDDIEAGMTLHYKDGKLREYALANDQANGGILLHVYQHPKRDIVVIRLNNAASKYTELYPINLQ